MAGELAKDETVATQTGVEAIFLPSRQPARLTTFGLRDERILLARDRAGNGTHGALWVAFARRGGNPSAR